MSISLRPRLGSGADGHGGAGPVSRREALVLAASGLLFGSSPAAADRPRARTQFGVNTNRLLLDGFQRGGHFHLEALQALGRMGIPFARFAASGQWAGDWAQFEADPARHWAGLDTVFAAAEQHGVRLIPAVLWHAAALALHSREPMQAWADPRSRTRQLAHRYTQTFVERYDRSPALMIYEFSNELNDWVDLPNITSFWPKLDPTLPDRKRVAEDRLSSMQLHAFVQDFARTIRQYSRKPISMGSNTPRGNAWHLARGSWELDTRDQVVAQLRAITPPAVDVLSIHLYEVMVGQRGSAFPTLPDLLTTFAAAARLDRRTTLVGEFGVPRLTDRDAERRRFANMVQAIGNAGITYAALWNVSLRSFQPDLDVAPDNDRAYQLAALVAANGRG